MSVGRLVVEASPKGLPSPATDTGTSICRSIVSAFKRDPKRFMRQGHDVKKLEDVVERLALGKGLDAEHRERAAEQLEGFRSCRVEPDWVLVYKIDGNVLMLTLARAGSRAELGP